MSLFSSFFILLLILVQSSPPTSASISRLGKHTQRAELINWNAVMFWEICSESPSEMKQQMGMQQKIRPLKSPLIPPCLSLSFKLGPSQRQKLFGRNLSPQCNFYELANCHVIFTRHFTTLPHFFSVIVDRYSLLCKYGPHSSLHNTVSDDHQLGAAEHNQAAQMVVEGTSAQTIKWKTFLENALVGFFGISRWWDLSVTCLLQNRLDFIANLFCVKSFFSFDVSYDETNENGMYMECLNSSNGSRSPRSYDKKGLRYAEATARWRTLAGILDRVFFLLYLIAIILSTVFIFPR